MALAQWLKVAPKSQDLPIVSKDLLAAGQRSSTLFTPIFLTLYDPICAMRCRALAATALVCLFSASVDVSLADALISTPLCDTLIRSAALTIVPITLDDNALRLPFQCLSKIVQHLSLCCMTTLSSYHSIASSWSDNVEFKDMILRLLSEGQPDFKPHVITILFYVSRTCPKFIQKLFDDESKVGPHAIGSVVRSILDFLDDYSQRCAIVQRASDSAPWDDTFSSFRMELADENTPLAARRDAEKDEFDFEPVSLHNLQDWRSFMTLSRRKGLM